MKSIRDQYPHLAQLLSGYFHQDWMLDHEDEESVLRMYLADTPRRKARAAAREIEALLASGLDEPGLRAALERLGCSYDPGLDGLSADEWLSSIRQRLLSN